MTLDENAENMVHNERKLSIVSKGTPDTTRVYLNGEDISDSVQCVHVVVDAELNLCFATLKVFDFSLDLENVGEKP